MASRRRVSKKGRSNGKVKWFESEDKSRPSLERKILDFLRDHRTFFSTETLAKFFRVRKKQIFTACLSLETKNKVTGRRKRITNSGKLVYISYETIPWAYVEPKIEKKKLIYFD